MVRTAPSATSGPQSRSGERAAGNGFARVVLKGSRRFAVTLRSGGAVVTSWLGAVMGQVVDLLKSINRWCFDGNSWQSAPVPKVYFDEQIAERYDADNAGMFEPTVVDPAVSFLASLAGESDALELGIGTGRIALPLSQRGVRVHGIDLSPAMIARLRAKPDADDIRVTIGDFASTNVGGTFGLAYLVFNAIMSLTTQDQQVECFRNAAAHLGRGGCFVIEVMVPDLRRLPPGQNVVPFQVSATGWGYDVYDLSTQAMSSNYVHITDGRGKYTMFPGRYVWAAELDLMARLAGMSLRERWGGWKREPFTSESSAHVSVWEKRA